MKEEILSVVTSFYIDKLDKNQFEKQIFFGSESYFRLIMIKINQNHNFVVQINNKQYQLGDIDDIKQQITLQIEKDQQLQQNLIIHFYQNEILKNVTKISYQNPQFKNLQKTNYQKQNQKTSDLFVYTNFKIKQLTFNHQSKYQCLLEVYSIFQNQNSSKVCIFNYISSNNDLIIQDQPQPIDQIHKRNLEAVQYIHGSYMKSIVRNINQNSQTKSTIFTPQTLTTYLIVGYFKLTQTINTSLPPLPIITLAVQSEYYNFLNLYIQDSTHLELKYIHDSNNQIKKQSEIVANFQNVWTSFGIIYSRTTSEAKFVYSDSNSKLQQSTVISSASLPSTIARLDVCISCRISGGVFGSFDGYYSSVKIIQNVDFSLVDQYSLFNEATEINKSNILSNSFNQNSYVSNSEYDVGQGFNCNQGYAFYEGICINSENCKIINFEIDIHSSAETGKFFDSSLNKCLNCGSNCLQCTSNTICTSCRPGYKIYQNKCLKCDLQNSCSSSCTGSQVFDPINQICIDSYNASSFSSSIILISSRIINDNFDIEISPPFSQINDIIIHCYLDVDNNPMTLISFLGGPQFTSSVLIKKSWSNVPKGYQKIVTFYVLFYDTGSPSNLQVKINQNIATLDNSIQTLVQNKISCSGSGSQTQSVFKVKFYIKDYEMFFDLEIQSNINSWGIRNLSIEISKCHPTCDTCKLGGGGESECSSCKTGMIINKFQCTCPQGQFAKYLNNCFDSSCVVCSSCSISHCQKCEDITGSCTQCEAGYTIKDGQCIQESLCTLNDSIYFKYCGISIEDGFSHFKSNKIVQYGDYWKFYNNNVQAFYVNNLGQYFLPAIGQNHQHTLTMSLPNYQSYHYQVNFQLVTLIYLSIDLADYIILQDNSVEIFKKNYEKEYGSLENLKFTETGQFLKSNTLLQFKFISKTDSGLSDEGFSFKELEFFYKRCHPMCTSCTNELLQSCTNCISNANKADGINCQCNEGYYFNLVRIKASNNQPGRCLKCNSACKTCTGPSYQDCILCQDGYTLTNNICQFKCQDGYYLDQGSMTCQKCNPCCRTCESSSIGDCHDCKQGFKLIIQDKTCMIYNVQCEACTVAVNSLCGGTQNSHDSCYSNGWAVINENVCVNCSKFVNNKCGGDQSQEVIDFCKKQGFYNYNSNNCSSCRDVVSNTCGRSEIKDLCYNDGWDKFNSKNCMDCKITSPTFNECKCDSTCSTCTRYFNPTKCSKCKSSLYLFDNQCFTKCPNGYAYNGTECSPCTDELMPTCVSCYKTCLICDPFQISTNNNSCTSCSNLTRQLTNGQCLCQDDEDKREIFHECSFQNIAVLNAVLSNTDPVLTIDFGKELHVPNPPNGFQQNQFSLSLCSFLFTDKTIQLIGSTSLCSIQDKTVVVNLDDSAMVMNGNFVNLKSNILSFSKTQSTIITKYMNNVVIQDKIIGNTKVQFDYVQIENSCNDINIQFNQIINDAKRGFYQYGWMVKKFVPENLVLQSALEKIIQKANSELSLKLLIPKGIIKLGVKVTILFSYTLKANIESYEDINLQVKPEKKLTIEFQTPNIFPMLRYQNGIFIISPIVRQCDPSGDIIIKEPLNFSIKSAQFPDINYSNSTYDQQDYTLQLKPFAYPALKIILNVNPSYLFLLHSQYIIINFEKVQVNLVSNSFIEVKTDYEINVEQSDLYVKIIGGNGYYNHKKQVIIEGIVRDLDIEKEDDPQGINIQWSCIDPTTLNQCVNKLGTPITFPSQQLSAKIEPFTFNPYSTIKILLIGDKPINRSSTSQVIVLFSEFDLPSLGVEIQMIDIKSETVNLNEELFVVINYTSTVNVDLLSFSGTIQYENEVVGIIKFDYTSLRFQIWNYYSNFKRNSPEFQIRFNVFNPTYYMPSMFLSTLNINFPPKNCKFTVFPTSGGISLETRFIMQFEECDDENEPIQYQFFFYRNKDDFEYEKRNPLQVQRRQITDKQSTQMIETSLPYGQILILGQAIDSKNAIYNTTISITVNKKQYDEQTYLTIIQQKLDLVNQISANSAISELSILSDDVLQRPELKQTSSLNDKKIEIINQLNTLLQNLSPLSTFATVVEKSIKSLIDSGITYNQSQQTDLLDQLINTLDESSNLKISTPELSKEKLKQKLYDSYSVLNALGNLKSDTESGQKYLELTEKIGQNLFKNILPNEDPIHFNGDNLSIFGTQMTEKYLCNYFFCEVQSSSEESKQSQIYNFKKSQYNNNPYSNDASFQEYKDQLKKQDQNTQITTYPIISPKISNLQNDPVFYLSQKVILSFPNKAPESQQKNMTCLTKSDGIKWTKQGCNNIYNKKYNTYSCICDGLSPTTIMDDLQDLFENSNINTAFSEEGLSNISNFDEFYKYGAFWVLLSQTILFFVLYKKGKLLDEFWSKKKSGSPPSIKVQSPSSISRGKVFPLNNDIKDKVSIQQKMEQNIILEEELDQYSYDNRKSLAENQLNKEDQKNIINEDTQKNDIEQGQLQSVNNSPFIEFMKQSDENQLLKNPFELQGSSSRPRTPQKSENQILTPSHLQVTQKQDILNMTATSVAKKRSRKTERNSFINYSNQKISHHQIEHEQVNTKTSIKDQNKQETLDLNSSSEINKNYQQMQICKTAFKDLPKIKKVLIFHNFFGIFYIYNPDIPRSLRFLIFYVRSIHSIGISVVFDKTYSIVQQVALSIVSSVLMIIVIKMFGKLFTYKSKIGIIISRFIIFAVLTTYYYIILSIISGQTPSQSNTFFEAFALFFLIDIFVVSTISAFFQKHIAFYIFGIQQLKGIQKLLFKLIELQLILLQLQ